MRKRTTYVLLLPVTLLLLAVLPIYPASSTETLGWPRMYPEYVNGTAFLSIAELVGGGLDWTSETTNCALDAGRTIRYRAIPAVLVEYVVAAFAVWASLAIVLREAHSARARAGFWSGVGGSLLLTAGASLAMFETATILCPPDVELPRAFAAGVASAGVVTATALIISRNRLGRAEGPDAVKIRARAP